MNVVECTGLTKLHGRFKALDDVTITIKEHTITGLIGRNGAGKTTLLKIIAGFWRESAGEIKVFSERPFNNLLVSANSIMIDDQMSFSPSLTLGDVLEQGGVFYKNWDMDFAQRLFDYFSFHPGQFHQNLSKGKKSTFNMILGLASRCALTIFDEPTTGMDTAVRSDFYRAVLKDYLAHPRTIIISSHHLDEIENLLEDILLIEDGKKRLHLPIDDVKEYAVGLTGNTTIVMQLVQDREVYFKRTLGTDQSYLVLKSDAELIQQAKRLGIEVTSVTTSDLCMYMTNKVKGGIDDVFVNDSVL